MIRWLKFAALLGIGFVLTILPTFALAALFIGSWVVALLSLPSDFRPGPDVLDVMQRPATIVCLCSIAFSAVFAFALAIKGLGGWS